MDDLVIMKKVLVVTSTTGDGDLPMMGEEFWTELSEAEISLSNIEYSVCALGDSSHFDFCGAGKKVDEKFSGMINALSYGAPPHGGIAPGIDRIVMLLANEKNIREVTMFPMNQNAQDLMMNAPSEVNENQLKELNLSLKLKK